MHLRQEEVVVAVAGAGGSRRLHVVQSAVSGTVRALERELSTPLFDRTTHRVALISVGEAFLTAYARRPGRRAGTGGRRCRTGAVARAGDGRQDAGGVGWGSTAPWPRCVRSIRAWS
ncbi:LysR family transcriptional regulator [Streptomyces sp. NPDC007856]|uniref:LysR family transcriptional regulator n=1 Tax=Streptomyces sp. NPDC007856 TaxID=3364781 RepID=UPI0036B599AB